MKKLLNNYKELSTPFKASIWFLFSVFVQKGISVIATPIFTRLMSASEYGQYSVFDSWLSIISIFVSLNLTSGVYLQGLVKFDSEKEEYTSSLVLLSTTIAAFSLVSLGGFQDFFGRLLSLDSIQMLSLLIMIWTTSMFNFWAARQRVEYKYKVLVLITLLVSLLKPVIGVIFVSVFTDKVTARIVAILLVEIVFFTPLFFVLLGKSKRKVNFMFWKYALVFNLPLIPHYLSQTVLNSADRIMIKNMISTDKAGIYSLAYSIAVLMTLFNTALMQTLSPWIYQKIKAKQFGEIKSIAYFTMILIAFVNILLIFFAPEAVRFFAPPSYYEAIWIIPPVTMSVYFMFIYDLFAKFAFYYEKTRFIMFASVIGAIVNIALNYIFIPQFGYIAAGYTTLFCYIIYGLGHYIFMNRVCDLYCGGVRPYEKEKVIIISLTFLIIGNMVLLTYNYPLWRFGLILVLLLILLLKRRIFIQELNKILQVRKQSH